jgi:DNA recombination protein RmuC
MLEQLTIFILTLGGMGAIAWMAHNWIKRQEQQQNKLRQEFDAHQIKSLTTLQNNLQQGMNQVRQQVNDTLKLQNDHMDKNFQRLTQEVNTRLKEISGQVDKQLTRGFEKTTQTFTDVIKRLTIIDEAQKKIAELSTNVVSLQAILSDKKSRGAFGEVQLSGLIHNMIPEQHFSLQHTLSNGKRPDCYLFLPQPTGNIAIDAKFPLESFHQLQKNTLSSSERSQFETQFKNDVKHHIKEIAGKYILPGETADGAMMFIPAEAVFAEIHAHYPEVVDFAYRSRVWLVSPTTLMAVLTTARAVLKDEATRKQVHIIQEHLMMLGKDFDRFQKRMDNLSKHIQQAHQDVEQVHKSSQKITNRFNKIEKVELGEMTDLTAPLASEEME